MLVTPIAIVDELCRNADVAGGRIPAAQRIISPRLKPIIAR